MGLVLIWVLCGIVTAMIATSKGKDGCGWFLLGVLLGPFGILIAAVSAPDAKKVEKAELAAGDSRKCPMCAELVKREAIKCRYCGADLPPLSIEEVAQARTVPQAADEASEASIHFTGRFNCPGCSRGRDVQGSRVVDGKRFCAECATRL